MDTVHTYPVNDLIEHDTSGGDCICGPTTEAVFQDDGSNGWLTVHHSLDGREHREPDHNRAACPTCQSGHVGDGLLHSVGDTSGTGALPDSDPGRVTIKPPVHHPNRMPTPPTRRNLTRHASQPNREGMPPEGQTTSPDAA